MKLRLEEWMAKRNVSQAQIAAALGLTRSTVSSWLIGKVRPGGVRTPMFPDYDSLEALCLFLDVTPNDLLQLERESIGTTWRDVGEPRRGRPPKATAQASQSEP